MKTNLLCMPLGKGPDMPGCIGAGTKQAGQQQHEMCKSCCLQVSSQMIRGISGGQKKRVTTAEMISGPKRTLFMASIASLMAVLTSAACNGSLHDMQISAATMCQ